MLMLRIAAIVLYCLAGDFVLAADPPSDGLVLWLDATDTDADGGPANEPADGAYLARWSDKSDEQNHVEQSDEAHQPTLEHGQLGGQPVVRFHGDDLLARA